MKLERRDAECNVIVGEDGDEEWGERIEEACEKEEDGEEGGGVEEGECSVIVGENGSEEWRERMEEVCEQEGWGRRWWCGGGRV